MSKPIIILGTGGNCIDILDTLLDINDAHAHPVYHCLGFLDDDPNKHGTLIAGVPVLGALDAARDYPDVFLVNGIGSPHNFWKKADIIAKTGAPPDRFETIIHPSASVSRMARLGRGVVVFQQVAITSGVQIGDHVIILPQAVVSHDDVIGAYTSITGGVSISGNVEVGALCYLGTNCAVRGGVRIGARSLIGMGSMVLDDVPENSVMVGAPARFLRHTCGDEQGI